MTINNNLKQKLKVITNSLNNINQENSECNNKLSDSMTINENYKNQIINSNNNIKLLGEKVDSLKVQINDIKNNQ
jgi:predicted  nucleic acid-binding Zn-ribbon protein